jgi:hypothetical protein
MSETGAGTFPAEIVSAMHREMTIIFPHVRASA